MTHPQQHRSRAIALAAISIAFACSSNALAQSLMVSAGEVIAGSTGPVPGLAGGELFGTSSAFDSPVLDDSGKVWFRGSFTGGSVVNTNSNAYFYGATNAGLTMVMRSGDPEPSATIPGATLNAATATGLGSSYHLSAAGGRMLWGSNLNDGGVNINSTNDSALFVGDPVGGWSVLAREGDTAPGTPGCTYGGSFTSPSQTAIGVLDTSRVLFKAVLLGGDVTGTNDNDAYYAGTIATPVLIMREERTQILTGEYVGSLGNASEMNASGDIMVDATLDTAFGPTPATSADDRILFIYNPTNGLQQLLREGDVAPSIVGATFTFGSTFSNLTSFNSNGEVALRADLLGAVTTNDDDAVYKLSLSGHTLMVRKGDACPGVAGATFNLIGASTLSLNDAGTISFSSSMNGTVGSSDNTGIWIGTAGSLQLVAQEGAVAPGTSGSTFGDMASQAMRLNNAGQLLFNNILVGGGTPGTSLWSWDPICGLRAVLLPGDSVEFTTGQFGTVTGYSAISSNNGSARPLCFSDDGTVAVRVNLSTVGGTRVAIAKININSNCIQPPTSYCTAGTTTNGCVATISATDNPSLTAATTCDLSVANVEGQKSGLLFYGLATTAGSWCATSSSFLCVKSPTQRTTTQSSGGTNNLCDGTLFLDWNAFQVGNPTSLGNPWTAGDFVYVQAWFRDPPACKTTNLSDALQLTYIP